MSYYTESPEGLDLYEEMELRGGFEYAGSGPSMGSGWLLGLLGLVVFLLIFARGGPATAWPDGSDSNLVQAPAGIGAPVNQRESLDPYAFRAPYERYVLTQGLHGQSYGHLAIDLAAGKGSNVLSPISGTVKDVYVDQWGNPTIVIQNEIYEVKMLHGIYSVSPGDVVEMGEVIGVESNLGYTTDMRGVPCAGRSGPCGYHTHLNVYDKVQQTNVNPLTLIGD